jgi:L-iditol 2-dehydrogenase
MQVAFEMSPLRRKELSVFNVRRSNHESGAALEMIAARPELFAPLITHTRPMDRIAEAFAIAEGYQDGVGKIIVKP